MKKLLLLLPLFVCVTSLSAQFTASGFVISGGEAESSAFSYGQLFAAESLSDGSPVAFSVVEGVQQSLLIIDTIEDENCENVDYADNNWNVPASAFDADHSPYTFGPFAGQTYEPSYNPTQYTRSIVGYDSATMLTLVVNPTYTVEDTVLLYTSDLATYQHDGNSVTIDPATYQGQVTEQTVHGCDSVINIQFYAVPCPLDTFFHTMEHPGVPTYPTILDNEPSLATQFAAYPNDGKVQITSSPDATSTYDFPVGDTTDVTYTASVHGQSLDCNRAAVINYFPCPATVDLDGDTYPVTRVLYDCWTKTNLHNENYADGTPISSVDEPMVYHSSFYPDEAENLANYGRLYTWAAATNDGTVTGTSAYDGESYVQGICPDGWHLPSDEKYNEILSVYTVNDMRAASSLWLPIGGTDLSTFSALPGGLYNASADYFEQLRLQAYFWTYTTGSDPQTSYTCVIGDDCSPSMIIAVNRANGNSVRCLMNY